MCPAMDAVKPLNLPLGRAVEKLLEAVEIVGDVSKVMEACRFYEAQHKTVTAKRVADVVPNCFGWNRMARRFAICRTCATRLARFASAFQKDANNVVAADIQAWLDCQKFSPANRMSFRRTIHRLSCSQ